MTASDRPLELNPTSGGEPIPPDERPEVEMDGDQNVNVVEDESDDEGEDDDEDEDDDSDDSDEEDFVASLPPHLRKRVDQMKDLNKQREAFMEEYLKERAALEKKYNDMCKPLYEKRRDIVNGNSSSAGSDKDSASASVSMDGNDDKANDAPHDDEEDQGVPEFWMMGMNNIETVEELITERDSECLQYLQDITCEDFDNGLGFTLYFHFKENPFFTNPILTKRYDVPNLLIDDEPILKNVVGCEINWKNDMCLTFRRIVKKQRNKKGQIRHVNKKERSESFFHFFSPPKLPDMQDIDEEEADAIEEAFDHDYDVAQQFRSYIIPKAVLWFTGEAMESALEGVFQGEDHLLSMQMQKQMQMDPQVPTEGNPFPPPVNGSEEPECKQS